MRWEGGRESSNVEDRRGFPIGGRGASLGCGGVILLLVVSWLTGINPLQLLNMVQQSPSAAPSAQTGPSGAPGRAPGQAPSDQLGKFASVVLASTEDVWKEIFQRSGKTYQPATLVLFSGAARSACGMASMASGPFYCQLDRKVYLDTSFFRELSERFGAPGDFADAYVVAHEIGHHVQDELGIFDQIGRSRADKPTSVRIELQADCYAGVWGNHASNLIEPGDFEEGLRAASAIGDDRLQKMGQGYVAPESFTHGSAQDRQAWLRRGLESGDPGRCDTFRGPLQ
ncbi:MAG: neutral zinc metallopeptidase [Acidobacteriota bacterium]